MKENLIFVVMGKSGAGKTSLAYEVSELLGIPILVSTTSRPMREREVEGRDYYYKTKEEVLKMDSNNEFVEYVTYNGWLYGVEKQEVERVDRACMVIVEPNGFKQFVEIYGDRVVPLLIETSDKNRLLRSLHRELKPNCYEICRRLIADTEDFKDVENDTSIKKIDNNNSQETSIEDICNFIFFECVDSIE